MNRDYVGRLERESLAFVGLLDRHPLVSRVIDGDASREEYVGFLTATYHYVRWSGPLLAETAEGLRRSGKYPWLVAIVDEKTEEESPHDGWVLDDLRGCGENVELVKSSAAPAAVQAYVQWSRTMAEEGSPAFLGAAYTLELISMHRAKVAAENLRARGAIPNIEGAVSFLVGHGDADVGHIGLLNEVLGRIGDPDDQADILLSAAVLRALYPRFFHFGALGSRSVGRSIWRGVAAPLAMAA
jgi:pyrroloquinoline quinone (PQQ) biosynthesis protein C